MQRRPMQRRPVQRRPMLRFTPGRWSRAGRERQIVRAQPMVF